jgi:hypothetical protein
MIAIPEEKANRVPSKHGGRKNVAPQERGHMHKTATYGGK